MGNSYIDYYEQITGKEYTREYKGPEQEGSHIKKCTILEPVKEIEYTNYCKNTNIPTKEDSR